MALPILDGNQTATTLSTILSSGAHIPAHTVVSLGAQAITDMRSAVSGSTISISNLPATQTIAGTVTANLAYAGNQLQWIKAVDSRGATYFLERISADIWQGGRAEEDAITISYNQQQGDWLATGGLVGSQYFAGNGPDSAIPPNSVWTYPDEDWTLTVSYEQPSIQQVTLQNSVTIGSLPAISGTVTASVTNSVTVGSLPVQLSTTTIGGTARLNVTLSSATTVGATAPSYANLHGGSDGTNLRAILTDTSGRTVVTGSVGISGTVPVSGTFYQATQPVSLATLPSLAAGTAQIGSVTASISGTVPVSGTFWQATQPVSGTVTATVASTTVTVSALPSGALTTRLGSVTTANTSQLTSCVTNSSRKYLLAQNISAGTVTIGIGFSPTTTQGIQLTAGAGITFDSFCPTGAVWWLGATTGATWTILEG